MARTGQAATAVAEEPSRAKTLLALMRASGREEGVFPVKRVFLTRDGKPGPLSQLVRNKQHLALDLYLLYCMCASQATRLEAAADQEPADSEHLDADTDAAGDAGTAEGEDETTRPGGVDVFTYVRPAMVSARALGLTDQHTEAAWRKRMTRANQALQRAGLIENAKSRRHDEHTDKWVSVSHVRLLTPGRPGKPMVSNPNVTDGQYFKVPLAWFSPTYLDGLSMRAKVCLLVLLANVRDGVAAIAASRIERFYGMSRDSVAEGMDELEAAGVIERWAHWHDEPLSPLGKVQRTSYRLHMATDTDPGLEIPVLPRRRGKSRKSKAAEATQLPEQSE